MSSKDNEKGMIFLLMIASFIIIIPFVLFVPIKYIYLKRKYINGIDVRRIIDLKNAFSRFFRSTLVLAVIIFIIFIIYSQINSNISKVTLTSLFVPLIILALFSAFKSSSTLATGLLGTVADIGRGTLSFQCDGTIRSYSSPSQYLNALFPSTIETIHINQIRNITRQAGRKALIHGSFGSRTLTFSDKMRRDELISIISYGTAPQASEEYELTEE